MKYLLMIHSEEQAWGRMNEAEQQRWMGEFMRFTEEIKASGHYVSSNRLHDSSSATTVRVRDGKRLVTDGPFAETREQLGGYYLIEANDLDEGDRHRGAQPGRRLRRDRGPAGGRGPRGGDGVAGPRAGPAAATGLARRLARAARI